MDSDRKSTVSSFYGRKSSDALTNDYAHTNAAGRAPLRDDASSFFGRTSTDMLGREEPLKGGRDEEDEMEAGPGSAGWDVYADFNNAGPRYAGAFGLGGQDAAYQSLPGGGTPKEAESTHGGPVEMVTVPAMGAEWGKDEMRDMTRAGKRERKAEKRKKVWREFTRGDRGGKWLTKRVIVFVCFGIIIVVAVLVGILIPRVPSFAISNDIPLGNATGQFASDVPTQFTRNPANFSFPAVANMQVDTTGNYVPLRFLHLRATVTDLDSGYTIATGDLGKRTLPAKSLPDIQLPLNFTYRANNDTDQTWLNWYNACKNKSQYSDGKRPSVRFVLSLEMVISGLIGTVSANLALPPLLRAYHIFPFLPTNPPPFPYLISARCTLLSLYVSKDPTYLILFHFGCTHILALLFSQTWTDTHARLSFTVCPSSSSSSSSSSSDAASSALKATHGFVPTPRPRWVCVVWFGVGACDDDALLAYNGHSRSTAHSRSTGHSVLQAALAFCSSLAFRRTRLLGRPQMTRDRRTTDGLGIQRFGTDYTRRDTQPTLHQTRMPQPRAETGGYARIGLSEDVDEGEGGGRDEDRHGEMPVRASGQGYGGAGRYDADFDFGGDAGAGTALGRRPTVALVRRAPTSPELPVLPGFVMAGRGEMRVAADASIGGKKTVKKETGASEEVPLRDAQTERERVGNEKGAGEDKPGTTGDHQPSRARPIPDFVTSPSLLSGLGIIINANLAALASFPTRPVASRGSSSSSGSTYADPRGPLENAPSPTSSSSPSSTVASLHHQSICDTRFRPIPSRGSSSSSSSSTAHSQCQSDSEAEDALLLPTPNFDSPPRIPPRGLSFFADIATGRAQSPPAECRTRMRFGAFGDAGRMVQAALSRGLVAAGRRPSVSQRQGTGRMESGRPLEASVKLTRKWPYPAVLRRAAAEGASVTGKGKIDRWTGFKWCLLVSVSLVFLYGGAALGTALMTWLRAYEHADVIYVADNDLLILITLSGTILVFSSLVGLCGVLLEARRILALYTILLWVGLASMTIIGYLAYKRDAFSLGAKLNLSWSQYYTPAGRLLIQNALHCCGFYSAFHDAIPGNRCYPRTPLPGCKGKLYRFERSSLALIWSSAFSLIAVHLLNIVVALLCAKHVTNIFGHGLTPKRYRLDGGDLKAEMNAAERRSKNGSKVRGRDKTWEVEAVPQLHS
ncbi:hypothetical protein MKEN_00278300 [Mycena kentingensis (nom. inval.)]|nr:hypothetical protein MKEN_00278300 [Mycena kentingensis (nom. inval.)]